jgi:hypothetical protein
MESQPYLEEQFLLQYKGRLQLNNTREWSTISIKKWPSETTKMIKQDSCGQI